MDGSAKHPDALKLTHYALGKLSNAELAGVCEHLAGCSACRDAVARVPEDRFIERLRHYAGPAKGVSPPGQITISYSHHGEMPSAADQPTISGLEIVRELGMGGMGVVYLALQTSLRRHVALKMIRKGAEAGPDDLARFRAEAEAVAALRHDNIVQIHEIGEQDGRPYFLLEYVDGPSLAQKIAQAPLPSRQAAAIVLTLAEAMHFAHENGIIHRDLKPSNVLLTARGQPKISDFGLAKRVEMEGGQTQSGAIVGTPSYMAPEQAAGKNRQVTAQADVYALGAILYELLVGRPPFKADTPINTVLQVLADEPVPPRRLQSQVPRDLETICLKCLEKDPARRYQGAKVLAGDLRRWLRNEPIRARPVGRLERVRKWSRRRPAAAALIAACVLLAFGVIGGALWYVDDRAHRRAETEKQNSLNEERVRNRLDQARQIRAELHKMLDDPRGLNQLLNDPSLWQARIDAALSELKEAKMLQAAGPIDPELASEIERLAGQLPQEQKLLQTALALEKAREEHAMIIEGKRQFARTLTKYRQAFAKASLDMDKTTPLVLARAIGRSPLRRQLLAALDEFAEMALGENDRKLHECLLATARLTDPDPLRDRLRDPKLWTNYPAVEELAREFLSKPQRMADLSAQTLALHGLLLPSGSLRERWLRQGHRLHPSDFWLAFDLGNALRTAKKHAEAAGYFSAALAIRPRSTFVWNNLALALADGKDLSAAIDAFKKALAIDKQDAHVWNNLGAVLYKNGDLPAAIDAYKKALTIDKKNGAAWNNLGFALAQSKDLPAAIQAYQKALVINRENPVAWLNLGNAFAHGNNLPAAIDAYRKALAIDKGNAKAWNNLGNALRDSKDLPAAIDAYHKALAIDEQDAMAWNNLGNALRDRKDRAGAIDAFRKAVAIDKQYAVAWSNLGNALWDNKDLPGAIDAYKKAVAIDKQYTAGWNNLGLALAASKDLVAAIDAFKKALTIDKQFAPAWNSLGAALHDSKDLAGAIDAYQKAVAIDKQFALAWKNLGSAFYKSKDLPRAIEAYQKALAIDNQDVIPHACLGSIFRDLGRLAESVTAFRQAAKLMPNDPAILTALQASEQALASQIVTKRKPLTEKTIKGALSVKDPEQVHELEMTVAHSYVIEMTTPLSFDVLDPFLRLENAKKTVLAENDDIDLKAGNLNSRIVFRPKEDGTYRIVATSFQQRGVGAYTITIREFAGKKK